MKKNSYFNILSHSAISLKLFYDDVIAHAQAPEGGARQDSAAHVRAVRKVFRSVQQPQDPLENTHRQDRRTLYTVQCTRTVNSNSAAISIQTVYSKVFQVQDHLNSLSLSY